MKIHMAPAFLLLGIGTGLYSRAWATQKTSPEAELENQGIQAQNKISQSFPQKSSAASSKKPAAPAPREIGTEIATIEHDPDYYAADASAVIRKGDFEKAYDQARQRALQRLAETVQATITSSLRTQASESRSGSHYREKEGVESMTETRARLVLSDPESNLYITIKKFQDYPVKSNLDVLVYVPKKKYREMEIKKSELKKREVEGLVIREDSVLTHGNVVPALEDLISARKVLRGYFGSGPVEMMVKNGKREMQSFIAGRINDILQAITLTPSSSNIVYTADGKADQNPEITATYKNPRNGKIVPVSGLALKASFITGKGELGETGLITNSQGSAEISLLNVDPSQSRAKVQVAADILKNKSGLFSAPQCFITLRKAKTIAYVLAVKGARLRSSLSGAVQRVLAAQGFNSARLPRARDTRSEIAAAARMNADYFLLIALKSGSRKLGDYDLYKGWAGGSLALYALPNGEIVFDVDSPEGNGNGMSASRAREEAISRAMPGIEKLLSRRLGGIK